ncbi:MerR family transcriptional regulator [Knoellia koreensis]|uniref:MerR family transcriptional regulator n=1 Tax=Knoellia koreensis TaxID=2730921 RepID=A0A849HEF2_9MICO|nr:MerR family transcriptional regulator [Knoellia sp. DB2414S]NNM44994.1 MerR family transcriptional regulator [Knoellia sp. DB2414S]
MADVPNDASTTDHDVDWPVGRVAERVGVPAATLRTWDRRYGIGPSLRTGGGHRRYTEEDVRRVRVMARFIGRGVPALTAARIASAMDSERLRIEVPNASAQTAGEDAATALQGTSFDTGHDSTVLDGPIAEISSAAIALHAQTLTSLYRKTLRERDLVSAWTDVFSPALRLIGEQWGEGALGVESEHLASELLVAELRAIIHAARPPHPRRSVLLAGADDEQHYLPLLALQAELARQGLSAAYLGPRLPTRALGDLITRRQPDAVFLWASMERPDAEPLWHTLATATGPLDVVLGGPGWPNTLPRVADGVKVTRVSDLAAAARALQHLPEAPG